MKNLKREKTYGIFSNIGFMLKSAYKTMPSVILFAILLPLLQVGKQTSQLLFTPALLRAIGEGVELSSFIYLIVRFTLIIIVLNMLHFYIKSNVMYGRIEVRLSLLARISKKIGVTSYPNVYNSDFQKTIDRGMVALSSNNSPGERIWETLSTILECLLGIIVYLILMKDMETWVIVLTVLTSVASFISTKRINEWGYRNRDEVADISKSINYFTSLAGNNIYAKDIRIFNMKPWINEVYDKAFNLYKNFISKEQTIYLLGDSIDLILSLLRNVIAYIYIVRLTIRGGVDAASFILLFNAINGFTDWMSRLLVEVNTLYKDSLEISNLRDALNYEELFLFEDGESIVPDINKDYSIKLNELSFKYDGADDYTLKNIDLHVKPGEKLAIVGLNGAGKTTLVKLMIGLYDPSDGEVLLNDEPLDIYNREDIYKHYTAVFQDFSLLAGSIYENVAQGEGSKIDYELADKCLESAGLSERVDRFPKGGHTNLVRSVYEDAVELSGGELQRLMLARALYKNAPILILDEPTAALDPIAENDIYLHYNKMTEGRTSIFISHRLASTRFCDRIIFIGEGKILEEGSHDELLAKNGYYRNLFDVQSKYYKDDGGIENEEESKK